MSCVFCCRTNASSKQLGIIFHSFPKDNEMRNAWIKVCGSQGYVLGKNINSLKLCSVHFTLNDYEEKKEERTFLKKGVVPTLFWRKPYVHCIVCCNISVANLDMYLHEFPENSILRKKWIDACRQNGFNIQRVFTQHRICSQHFSLNSFTQKDKGRKCLKVDAVPHIFSLPTSSASVQQGENSNSQLVQSICTFAANAASCSMVPPYNDKSINSSATSKCVDETCAVVRKRVKRISQELAKPATAETWVQGFAKASLHSPQGVIHLDLRNSGDMKLQHGSTYSMVLSHPAEVNDNIKKVYLNWEYDMNVLEPRILCLFWCNDHLWVKNVAIEEMKMPVRGKQFSSKLCSHIKRDYAHIANRGKAVFVDACNPSHRAWKKLAPSRRPTDFHSCST